MAGIRGNQAYIGMGKQAAAIQAGKVTPSGTIPLRPQFKNVLSGGSLGPTRNTDRLAETDSARDQGAAFVTSAGVEGTPEVYARVPSLGFWLGAVMGGIGAPSAPSGGNTTTTFTPANTLGYYTFWKNQADLIYERYVDCQVGSLTISAEAGQPLTAAAGIQGISSKRLITLAENASVNDVPAITALTITPPTSLGVAIDQSSPVSFNNAVVTLGGSVTKSISSFELTIENNLSGQQTDDVTLYDIAVGQREISLGFDLIFENINEYRNFHYGNAIDSSSPRSDIYVTSAAFSFTLPDTTGFSFTLPSIAYEEFPVEADPGGDPVVVSARAVAQRAAGTTDLLTATVTVPTATGALYLANAPIV